MVYFVGNALTQLMSLLLLRFVTGNISSADYGTYNLVVTIGNLIIPFLTLQISDALFKFVLRAKDADEKKCYFSTTFAVIAGSLLVTILGVFVINYFFTPLPHPILITLYLIFNNLQTLYHRIARSLGRNKVYVVVNLVKTALFLILEIVFIYVFHLGIETLFLSTIISIAFSLLVCEMKIRSLSLFDPKSIKRDATRNMLKYSAPLIPNTVFWWLTSSVNTLIVSTKLGLDINGIYTVSNKFSHVLTMVTSVFIMSWQESAISEYGTDKFKSFFTKTFNMYFVLVFSAIAVLVSFMNLVFPLMIDESYHASIQYAPFLLVVSGLSTLSGFLAQIFCAQGKTHRSMSTTAIGLLFNVSIVFSLVDKIGLWAAVLGSFSADFVMAVLRYFMLRKEFAKGKSYFKYAIVVFLLCVSITLYLNAGTIYNAIWFFVVAISAVILNFQLVKDLLAVLFEKTRFIREKK